MGTKAVSVENSLVRRWMNSSVGFHLDSKTIISFYFITSVLIVVATAAVLRLWSLGSASLWTDEAWTADRVHERLAQSLANIMAVHNHGPAYFLLLRVLPNSTEALLRLPSALLGLAGTALMIFIVARLYHDRERALWAGLLLAVNPFDVGLSRMARPYAMVFFLSLLVSFIFLRLMSSPRSRRLWAGFVIASMIAYATHYSTAALPATQYLVFVTMLRHKNRIFRRWVLAQAVAVAPTLLWVFVTLRHPVQAVTEWIPRPALHDIPLTLWNMLVGYDGTIKWPLVPGIVLVTLGLAFGVRAALRERTTDQKNLYWLWLIAATLIPVFIVSRFVISIYVDRYFTVCLPALLILTIEGWGRFPTRVRRLALGMIVVTSLYAVLFSFFSGSYRRADWQAVAHFVSGNVQPGDTIVVESPYINETFTYYYDAQNHQANPDPNVPIVLLSNTPDTTSLEQSATRLWIIYRNPNEDVHRLGEMPDFNPFDARLSPMGAWLNARRGEVSVYRKFRGVDVLVVTPHLQDQLKQPMTGTAPEGNS
jgi:uncharacterized membrane protein